MSHCTSHVGGDTLFLFVYGTLRRGFNHPMARWLAASSRYVGTGRVNGRLYHLGHYPGLVLSQHPDEWVYGDLYEMKSPARLLARLDRYEAVDAGRKQLAEYRRIVATVYPAAGEMTSAWVYCYQRPVRRLRRLVSGDFLRQRRRYPEIN